MGIEKYPIVQSFRSIATDQNGETALQNAFVAALKDAPIPENVNPDALFAALAGEYDGEELADVCAETVLTFTAGCSADDFHNWDYDHLSSIIELSNKFGFSIPQNLVNGLPEQLIILVDSNKLGQPGCD